MGGVVVVNLGTCVTTCGGVTVLLVKAVCIHARNAVFIGVSVPVP
jgi:hypothetical protein